MKILVDINHPAHVHFFKNFIWTMQKRGHQFLIISSRKDVAIALLKKYDLKYMEIGSYGKNLFQKIINIPILDFKMYQLAKKFRPDLFLGLGSFRTAQVSKLLGKPCFIFEDSEPTPIEHLLYFYFTDKILTPSCFRKNFGPKQLRYQGFHELAYLHPNYFRPDKEILKFMGVKPGEKFFILRFVGWHAGHDVGRYGLNYKEKLRLFRTLEKFGKTLISSENPLLKEFAAHGIKIPPEKMHSALFYAHLFIGDSQTMATEAALLGTPAIRCNSFAGPNDMGNFIELEKKYDLMYSFKEFPQAFSKIKKLLQKKDLKTEWQIKRKRLLSDKIDVTQMMIDLVEKNFDYKCSSIYNGIA